MEQQIETTAERTPVRTPPPRRVPRPKNAKKIRCPRCGKYKFKHEFYRFKTAKSHGRYTYSTYCKDCCSEIHKERYQPRKERIIRCKDGRIRHIKPLGEPGEGRRGASTSIYWSDGMLDTLRRRFPTDKNADLALDLGVSPRTLVRKARELGLEKDKELMHRRTLEKCKQMGRINKFCRNSGMFKKGVRNSPATEFKPGHKPQRRTYNDKRLTPTNPTDNDNRDKERNIKRKESEYTDNSIQASDNA